jgi:tRNA (guanosine-2'-O-)-methyltransferase
MTTDEQVIATLEPHISDRRVRRMRNVVAGRMKGLTVVMEDLYDPGNRSAVYRTAEGHGLRDVHVIRPEKATKAHARDVSRGSEKWLNIERHASTTEGVEVLRERGFSIISADLQSARPISSFTFREPTALVFGNEHAGITEEMRELSDACFRIPMYGFIQSYNISVAAALALGVARRRREHALGRRTDFDRTDREQLLATYMYRSVTRSATILERSGIDWSDPFR